jgi:hypothetical protein
MNLSSVSKLISSALKAIPVHCLMITLLSLCADPAHLAYYTGAGLPVVQDPATPPGPVPWAGAVAGLKVLLHQPQLLTVLLQLLQPQPLLQLQPCC